MPNSASASSKKRIAFEPWAASKIRPRFFSVSPTYLRHDRRQVDLEDVQAEVVGQHLGGHRLAGPGLAREQDLQALGLRDAALVGPVGQHLVAVAQVGGDRQQRVALAAGDDEVVPRVGRLQAPGERAQARGGRLARARVEVLPAHQRDPRRLLDLADREPELRADVGHVVDAGERPPRGGALAERRRADRVAQDGAVRRDVGPREHQRAVRQGVEVRGRVVDDDAPLERRGQVGVRRTARRRGSAPGPSARASSAGASGPRTTSGSRPRRAASSASRATSSSRPGSTAAASTRRSGATGSGARRRNAASRGATRSGRSIATGPSPKRTAPQATSGASAASAEGPSSAATIRGVGRRRA